MLGHQETSLKLEAKILSEVLLVYLIINELFRNQFDKLIELVRAQAFSINANIDYSAWRNLRENSFLIPTAA